LVSNFKGASQNFEFDFFINQETKKLQKLHVQKVAIYYYMDFLLFLLDDGRIREAQNPTDVDPEHCLKSYNISSCVVFGSL
jgi:hypothetical protein